MNKKILGLLMGIAFSAKAQFPPDTVTSVGALTDSSSISNIVSGSFININSGVGTNSTFYSGLKAADAQGTVTIGQLFANGSISRYDLGAGNVGMTIVPFLGGLHIFQQLGAGGNPELMTIGWDNNRGVSETIGMRTYWNCNESLNGACYTTYNESMGGSGAAMLDLPLIPNSIWANQKKPVVVMASRGNVVFTNATQVVMSNNVIAMKTNTIISGLTNLGITIAYDIENNWLTNHRDANGWLAWNTNDWPMATGPTAKYGPTNVANWLHTNGLEMWLMMYGSTESPRTNNTEIDVDPTTGATLWYYPNGPNNIPGGNYIQPIITSSSLLKDISIMYGWGVSGLTIQDTTANADLGQKIEQLHRQFAYSSAYPLFVNFNSPYNVIGPFPYPVSWNSSPSLSLYHNHGIVLNYLWPDSTIAFPINSEYSNGMAVESGNFAAQPGTSILDYIMQVTRVHLPTLTNWQAGTVHFIPQSDNLFTLSTWTWDDWKGWFSLIAEFNMDEWLTTPQFGFATNAWWGQLQTNSSYIRIWQDDLQNRCKVLSIGTTNCIFSKKLVDNSIAVLFVNQDPSVATNLTVSWAQLGIQSNVTVNVSEAWTNAIVFSTATNAFTINVRPALSELYIFTPIFSHGSIVNTNFVSGTIYSNFYNTPIEVSCSAALTVAGVTGVSVLEARAIGTQTNISAMITSAAVITGTDTNYLAVKVPINGTYTFTNTSSGAGNSSKPVGGQIFVY